MSPVGDQGSGDGRRLTAAYATPCGVGSEYAVSPCGVRRSGRVQSYTPLASHLQNPRIAARYCRRLVERSCLALCRLAATRVVVSCAACRRLMQRLAALVRSMLCRLSATSSVVMSAPAGGSWNACRGGFCPTCPTGLISPVVAFISKKVQYFFTNLLAIFKNAAILREQQDLVLLLAVSTICSG